MIRVSGLQLIEHDVHWVFEVFIVLSGLRSIDHFEQCGEIFLVFRCLIPDVANECCVIELFCLHPKILTGFIAISLRVDDDRIDQFEDVLFAADVGEGVVVHGLAKIDCVQRLDCIPIFLKHLAALN